MNGKDGKVFKLIEEMDSGLEEFVDEINSIDIEGLRRSLVLLYKLAKTTHMELGKLEKKIK